VASGARLLTIGALKNGRRGPREGVRSKPVTSTHYGFCSLTLANPTLGERLSARQGRRGVSPHDLAMSQDKGATYRVEARPPPPQRANRAFCGRSLEPILQNVEGVHIAPAMLAGAAYARHAPKSPMPHLSLLDMRQGIACPLVGCQAEDKLVDIAPSGIHHVPQPAFLPEAQLPM